jgi:hypothetical protein
MFLDSRQEDKVMNWIVQAIPELNLLLVSSWIKFGYVTVIPKYFNFATFLKGLWSILWFALHSHDFAFTSRQTLLV